MYQIFNVAIDSELELPELPVLERDAAVPVFRFAVLGKENGRDNLAGIEWYHDWVDTRGNITIRAGRKDARYLLRFPNLADFTIELTTRLITAYPEPGIEDSTLRHLLLDQVIPRVLGQQGALVLHAGAVQVDGGKTLAFVGHSGFGKSTLVSSFERSGARLITDDCMMVVQEGGRVHVVPNYAGVRLFNDSVKAIYGDEETLAEVAHYTSKQRVVRFEAGRDLDDKLPLDTLFLLGEPADDVQGSVVIRPARGASALMQLVAQSFLLDVFDKALVGTLFEMAGAMFDSGLSCFEIDYPRDHARLSEVRHALMQV
jgi:hypothetical protein